MYHYPLDSFHGPEVHFSVCMSWSYKELGFDSSCLTFTAAQGLSTMTGVGIVEVVLLLNKICESVEKVSVKPR